MTRERLVYGRRIVLARDGEEDAAITEAELAAIHEREVGLGVTWLRLSDRYGDMGLIAVAVLTKSGSDAVVHSFVLSCRAANRAIEQTLLAHLAQQARAVGCTRLVGEFIPTPKNGPVVDLYPRLGFASDGEAEGGVTRYVYDLANDDLVIPQFIRVMLTPARDGDGSRSSPA